MICEQQKPASGLGAVSPLSPPPTPGHKGKIFPSNFLTTSQENFCSTTVVNSATNTTTHGTTRTTDTGSALTPNDAADLQCNFNIPRFISTEFKPNNATREAKDSHNSHLSLSLPNTWEELHSPTSQTHCHSYPSPVSSPEEPDQSIQAILEASTSLHSQIFPSLHQQPSQEEQSYFHQHHHRHHRNQQHHLNHSSRFPTDTPRNHSEELPSIFNFVKPKEKSLFFDRPATDVDHAIHQHFSFSNPNNNCNSNNSKVDESDVRDIVTTQVNTTQYPYHRDIGLKRLNFDMGRTDVTTDINNNNNNNSSSHNFHTASTIKNDNNDYTHDDTQEMDNVFLPWTFLMSTCEEPSNLSVSDQSDFLAYMDSKTHHVTPFSELHAIMSDVHMTDNGSSTECDITDLKDVDIYEWEQLSDIMNSATYTSDLIPIADIGSTTDSSSTTSGDDYSDGDYKEGQHLQVLEVSSNFPNQLFNNSAHIGEIDRPQSPSNSDEGFVDCVPSLERDLPLGGKKLPFDGKFPETEDSEASSTTADSKKRPRKRQSPLKLKRKPAASPPGERRKPGRKPGQVSNVLHLWEFMRDLLHDPKFNGCIIEWISQNEGVFRVLDSAAVARLWGEKKNNKKAMTYEKLSRSLRYSRLEGYFANLPKDKNYPKKLCFKFGPKSKNWSLNL